MNFTYAGLDPVPVTPPGPHAAREKRTFQGVPGIVCRASGRLFATWYGGGELEGRENYIMLAVSDNGGVTWSDVLAVVDPLHPDVRAFDPVLWIAPDQRLFWFWAQGCGGNVPNIAREVCDGIDGIWFSELKNPDAPTAEFRFSPSRRIANGVMMNKPTVLADGTWALPGSVWTGDYRRHPDLGVRSGAFMVVSTDQGATFQVRGRIDMSLIPGGPSFDEHLFVERKDGTLAAYIRVNRGIAQSFSNDGGHNWTKPALCPSFSAPDTRFCLQRLSSGRLLLITNDSFPKREKLTAFLSEDDGDTWCGKLLLDGGMNVSYPDAMEQNGRIYLIYDQERHRGGYILMASITENDILAERLTDPASFLRREVDHSRPVPER